MPNQPANGRKTELRRLFRQRRHQLLTSAAAGLQQSALAELPALLSGGGRLGLYWPLPGEADLLGLAEDPQLQERLALPRVQQNAMHYRCWRRGDAVASDTTGIPAPTEGEPVPPGELALILAPALAFDRHGIRLGYGGGWFDRLRSQPAWRRVPALAVLPQACLLEQLPADPWDVPFDGWLDEWGVHWLQPV